ncbi:MAG TPA: translocation/assembly module TamB domain-containing protein [Steroidobacteraceae bacterium]
MKIAIWILCGLVLSGILVVGAVYTIGNTNAGRSAIERLTDRLTQGQVKLSGLRGSFPQHLWVDELELRDGQGIWLTARGIALDWSPLAYLQNRLQIDGLQIAGVHMQRLPKGSGASGGAEVSIPRIDVASMSIGVLQLDPQLAGAPTSLTLQGGAHLRSVREMSFDAAARRINGEGEYELHLRFDAKRMDASLKLHEPASGPLENILSLPGLGALNATLNLHGPRDGEQLEVSIQAGSLTGHARGSFDLSKLSADLDVDVSAGTMTPRPDLTWQSAALKGRWRGSLESPTAEGHLKIDGLKIPGDAQAARVDADIAADRGNAQLHALIVGLKVPGPSPRILESDPIKIDASARLDDPSRPLDLTALHRLFSLRGQLATAGRQSAVLVLRVPEIAPFAALAGQSVHGSAVINAQLDGYPKATRLNVDADAALKPSTELWARVAGDRVKLQMSGLLNDGDLRVDSMKISGGAVTLAASGDINDKSLKLRWDGELSDLSALSPVIAGALRAAGSLDGPVTSLSLAARATSILSMRGSESSPLSAEINLRGLPKAADGMLAVGGSLDGAPLNLEVAVDHRLGALHAVIQHADWKSAHAAGDITIATANSLGQGTLTVSVGQLKDLQHLLGMDMAGALSGELGLHPEGQRTRASLRVSGQDITVAGLTGSAHAAGDGFLDAFPFTAGVEIPAMQGAHAGLQVTGELNLNAEEVSLATALATYREQEIRLLAPTRIFLRDGLRVDALKVGAQKAELDAQGELLPDLNVHASLRGVTRPLINAFFPNLLAAGSIEGHADLSGTIQRPEGEVILSAAGIRMAADAALGLPAADAQFKVQLHGATADLDARLDAGSDSHFRAAGVVPLSPDGTIDMKVSGKLDFGMISPFLEARGERATGQLDIDATVGGSMAQPRFGGSITLARGSLFDYARGISLSDINAQIAGDEGTLEIKSFTASAPPGTVTMTGSIGIGRQALPLDLKITARNAQPVASKLITANLDADIKVSGGLRERLDIAGTVHLIRTVIGIPNGLPPNVAVLDVRRRGHVAAPPRGKALVIGLDISVQAPRDIIVQGRGLDAQMSGDLKVSGTTDDPQVDGGFDLQRGSLSLSSSRLNFTAGRVSFNGQGLKNNIDPTLDFTAQASVGETTAIVRITGLADAPVFEFSSSPLLPQDEILSLLLFGVPGSQLSTLQHVQIGMALASLSGVGGDGSMNPLVKVQKSLGLDRLSVASTTTTTPGTENSGASIQAGRYINSRLYVEARQSTTGFSQVEADVELNKHLKLQTRLGNGTATVQGTTPDNDPGSSIGLIYQFEY